MNQNYNNEFERLIRGTNFEGLANEKRKDSEKLAEFVAFVEKDNDYKNSILSHELYSKLVELSFDSDFFGILNLPSKIIQGIFDSIKDELNKDLFVYKAIRNDYFYPSNVKILSDKFINYIPQIETNVFWKLYLNIFSKDTELAESYKEERFYNIDRRFRAFKNNIKNAKNYINPSNLIERFVEDSLNNFVINYKTYLRAKKDLSIEIRDISIEQEKYLDRLYQIAINKKINTDEIVNLYQELKIKKLNLNSAMYDIMAASRASFNNMISDEINLKTNISSLPVKKENGVNVYTLSPENEATFLVHSHGGASVISPEELKDFYSNITKREKSYLMSMSIITQDNISGIYPVGKDLIVFGFQNIEPDSIAHSSIVDSFSRAVLDGNTISNKPQFLTSKEKFIENSAQYNEINYRVPCCNDENKNFYPSYIIVNDGLLKNYHYEYAKEFNIPIVIAPFVKDKSDNASEVQKNQNEANVNYFEP